MAEKYVFRVLAAWERCDIYEQLMWRVKDDTVRFLAICSDVFYWGTADCEEIAEEDLPMLESTADELLALGGVADAYMPELFCARKRGMRPQMPWGRSYGAKPGVYDKDNLDPRVRALFDACGPVRDRKDEG